MAFIKQHLGNILKRINNSLGDDKFCLLTYKTIIIMSNYNGTLFLAVCLMFLELFFFFFLLQFYHNITQLHFDKKKCDLKHKTSSKAPNLSTVSIFFKLKKSLKKHYYNFITVNIQMLPTSISVSVQTYKKIYIYSPTTRTIQL